MTKLPYKIVDIRINARFPRHIYATIVDENGNTCVNATLDYCVRWVKEAMNNRSVGNATSEEHPGFGPEADPDRDYEGENRFGPD